VSQLTFGFSLVPTLDIAAHRELVAIAEAEGLDLVGIQDHPYAPNYLDSLVLSATLLAGTRRINVFPDVANLPLRAPALLAKTAASLDLVSNGRFELGLGAGGYWRAITTMGVPQLKPAEANAALGEAIAILRAVWQGEGPRIQLTGEHYQIDGLRPGPAPAHPIGIWTGAQGPNALRLTGRLADGWAAPIPSYLPYDKWASANRRIDDAARDAGRDPRDVRRIAQLVGLITDRPGEVDIESGAAPIHGTPEQWSQVIARLATEQPFTTFVFWPETQDAAHILRWAREVVPAARALIAEQRPLG
jgi:alkanesulfonate monooxygenase SsuD/methylene tetrahydromethanopterin reductase-like flavin-dependent oxidoreductase (luciferase family)